MHLRSWWDAIIGRRHAPYVPTTRDVGRQMLNLARVGPGDVVFDLGCGDARLLEMAVGPPFRAARGVGYELDGSLVAAARERLEKGVAPVDVTLHVADIEEAASCLHEATVVVLYLSTHGNAAVLPMLQAHLRPSARVVSFIWEMPVPATRTVRVPGSGAEMHLFEGLGNALEPEGVS